MCRQHFLRGSCKTTTATSNDFSRSPDIRRALVTHQSFVLFPKPLSKPEKEFAIELTPLKLHNVPYLVICSIRELRLYISQLRFNLEQLMRCSLVLLVVPSRPTQSLVSFGLQNRFSSRIIFEQRDFSSQKFQMQITSLNLLSQYAKFSLERVNCGALKNREYLMAFNYAI